MDNVDMNFYSRILSAYSKTNVSIVYSYKGKSFLYTGKINYVDLIHKNVYLFPKKKISFSSIISIK